MRTLCDGCEIAAAILFCAADEAALCHACDHKVHECNKLASTHVRVGLSGPTFVPSCDICQTASAFFYCVKDGSSLCLKCDMIVHVGGKIAHERYLLMRQRIEFPDNKYDRLAELGLQQLDQNQSRNNQSQLLKPKSRDVQQNHRVSSVSMIENIEGHGKMDNALMDLNTRPR